MLRKIFKATAIALMIATIAVTVGYMKSRRQLLGILDEDSQIAQTAKGRIQYSLRGTQGPVVLFSHGTPGGFNHSPFFSARGFEAYRILTPSRPGYMDTPLQVGRTPAEQAAAFAALLDELGIARVVVMSVSGGGPAALAFAEMYPERTLALVALESLSQRTSEPLEIPIAMQSDFLFWAGVNLAIRMGGEMGAAGIFPEEDQQRIRNSPDGRERANAWLWATWPAAARVVGWRNDSQQFMQLALRPEHIQAPTLVLHGTADEAASYASAVRLSETIPNAHLHTVYGASHAMLITHKDELNELIAEFLREVLAEK